MRCKSGLYFYNNLNRKSSAGKVYDHWNLSSLYANAVSFFHTFLSEMNRKKLCEFLNNKTNFGVLICFLSRGYKSVQRKHFLANYCYDCFSSWSILSEISFFIFFLFEHFLLVSSRWKLRKGSTALQCATQTWRQIIIFKSSNDLIYFIGIYSLLKRWGKDELKKYKN